MLDNFDIAFYASTVRPAHYWGELKRRANEPPAIRSVKRFATNDAAAGQHRTQRQRTHQRRRAFE